MLKRLTLPLTFILLALGFVMFVAPQKASAIATTNFNPNRIIDDSNFFNGNTMGVSDIQAFLNAKVPTCDINGTQPIDSNNPGGQTRAQWAAANGKPAPPYTCLRQYSQTFDTMPADSYCSSVIGGTRSAADIIAAVGQACGISPKVILITLQKEQILVVDDWPFPVQFQKATGYACPDTAPCDPDYAGFFKQVYYGARQFKRYAMQPNSFNYAVGRTSFVGYNPNGACGGTNLTPNTQATAALYNYTPYQPNPATLVAPEGVEVNCGAYGNLNFWRKYNDWFGPTLTDEFAVIIADNGDPTQWVLENGKRYVIPDTATKIAWGLSPKWDQPYTFNGSYISTIPNGPTLNRTARPSGGLAVYFVDAGKKYKFGSAESLAAWGYSVNNIIDTPPGLSSQLTTQGDVTYTVSMAGSSNVYLMDGGTLRAITDPNILAAWAGDTSSATSVSNNYFSSKVQGTLISTPKITDGTTIYFVDNSRKLPVDSLTSQLYPTWSTYTVSPATLARLATGPQATYVIKTANSPSTYIVDRQNKHFVTDPYVLDAWQSSTFPSNATTMTQGFVSSITSGVQLTDYIMTSGSNTYVLQRGIRPVPANLVNAYSSGRTIYDASSILASLYPRLDIVSGIVKAFGQPQAYIITDTGKLRHLTSTNLYWLWGRGQTLTELTPENLGRYVNAGGIGAFVTDNTTNYIIEGSQKHVVDAATKTEWSLGTPEVLDGGTIGRITTGIALPRKIQNSGAYFMVHAGKAYGTADANISALWGINDAPTLDLALISQYLSGQMLTRVASSSVPGDSRLFIVDRGTLYRLYPNHALNLAAFGPYTPVNPDSFTVKDWTSTLVKDEAGTTYAIDAGTKRLVPIGIIRDQWTYGNNAALPTMTNGFLNMLPNNIQLERAIKGSSVSVYSGEDLKKRLIQNPNTYASQYAPFTIVTDAFMNTLPVGQPIP